MRGELEKIASLFSSVESFGFSEFKEIIELLKRFFLKLNSLEIEDFRSSHFELSQLAHLQGHHCLPFFCNIIKNGIHDFIKIPAFPAASSLETDLSHNDFFELFKRCMLAQSANGIRVLDYKVPDLSPWTSSQVLPKVVEMLEYLAINPLEESCLPGDLASVGNCLGMSRELSRQNGVLHETYIQFEAILERLARDGYHQIARDYAEEAIVCAVSDGCPEYGHYCRFSLASLQQNPIDASIHGGLLLASLSLKDSIPQDFQYRVLSALFTFFRNIHDCDTADSLYEMIMSLEYIGPYNRQKTHTAYLNLLLMSDSEKALYAANDFATENLEEILRFGDASAVPWLAIISSLKFLHPQQFHTKLGLVSLESHIESVLSENQIESIRDAILPRRGSTKKMIIDALDKLHLTRNGNDHIYEVNRLQFSAARLLESSLEIGDIEGVVLAHRVMSDGSLAFELNSLGERKIIRSDDVGLNGFKGRNEKYFEMVCRELLLCDKYRYVWLGFDGEKLYYLICEDGQFLPCGIVPNISKAQVFVWLEKDLPKLGFNDSPITTGPLITREDIWLEESKSIRKNLPKLYLPESKKNTIVFCDIEMSCFPHNFISEPNDGEISRIICNPLSLDNYLRYKPLHIDVSEVSIWAPIEADDTAILLAHGRLISCMAEYKLILSESMVPNFERQTDIKAFICHGGRSKNGGFTGLYPSDDKKYISSSILGSGKVAVLFICHGGHVNSDVYARSFQALAKNLLSAGYEAVIAPSWSLNVVIPGPWMTAFIGFLTLGGNIVDASLYANNRIKSIYPVESAWAAMHVFGNPHVYGKSLED